jgi:ComF family protein
MPLRRGRLHGEYIGPMFRQLLQGISRRIPSQCAVCHRWPARPVCDACVQSFAQPRHRCLTCALPLPPGMAQCGKCITEPPPLDRCIAAVAYTYPWATLVVEFKFKEHTAWASTFATLMRSAPWVEPALDAADLLIPMPLSRQRLLERGFNQTLVLARALAPELTAQDVLVRVRDTPPQSALPRVERLQNVRAAYTVDPLQARRVAHKRVVLLDDVMTSGASLHAAAQALRAAGASHITGLVFARTE